jgi:hypothetical protein
MLTCFDKFFKAKVNNILIRKPLMNIIFIEPSFPYNQKEFVRGLHAAGANVIGIGERPQEYLSDEVKAYLRFYVQVQSVVHEPTLLKAVQKIQKKFGSIDWKPPWKRT